MTFVLNMGRKGFPLNTESINLGMVLIHIGTYSYTWYTLMQQLPYYPARRRLATNSIYCTMQQGLLRQVDIEIKNTAYDRISGTCTGQQVLSEMAKCSFVPTVVCD